ncbi:extracellular solute-binding protein [Frigoribacterium sp. NBH87]|uniref:extracellular solute-binding protein n=1 Tax=Frigoribacterium sp. NBH87 TaxID=2596916 RepID=UPI001624569D|nr:extracellular solute-binding protein [Frigoribacterium sp. NBH87]QNE43946.1 extracellular solute-binding protein [Frigoribacterium sp. NBH87]
MRSRPRADSTFVATSVGVLIVAASAAGIAAFGASTAPAPGARLTPSEQGETTVTVRLWDETVAAGYEKSFAAFERDNPDIDVEVEVVPYADYFDQLADDVDDGDAPDVYWLNSSHYDGYAEAGDLVDVDAVLGESARRAWSPAVVDQFTHDGSLWGVPQLSDGGIALYYNADLLAAAGVDPASLDDLTWAPGGGADDTLLPLLQRLTLDDQGRNAADPAFDGTVAQYGYNAGNDLQAIWYDYLGSAGGRLEDPEGASFELDTPEAQAAFQYLVDLVGVHRVAPPAAATNADPDHSRDLFTAGHMALFQSGLYSLSTVESQAQFDWGVAMMPAGPAGRVSVSNGIVAAGDAHTAHLDDTAKVLAWLGSTDGAEYIGRDGAAVPAVTGAQEPYYAYWASRGVDVSPFFDVIASGDTIPAPTSLYGTAQPALDPLLDQVFAGSLPVPEGLAAAQAAAEAAVAAAEQASDPSATPAP